MTSYQKSIILEANHLNSIEYKNEPNTEKANDFTIQIPSITLPKGSQITLDGCIINENGASNSEVLELSNQNFSNLYPYQSSFQAFQFLYYINHTGQNLCAAPLVSHNGYNTQQGDTTKQNKLIVSWKTNADIFYGFLVIGMGNNVNAQYPINSFANRNAHSLRDYIYDNTTGNIDENQAFSFFKEGEQIEKEIPNPFNDYNTQKYWWYASSPVNCATAIKRNKPDGTKYVLIDASYKGPSYHDCPCKPLTSITKINLSDKLLETPDEINFKINQTFTKSRINAPDNYQNVNGLFYSTDTDPTEIETVENQFDVFNFSGQTIKNVPCNLQTRPTGEFYHHRAYSNMYVKDYKRWMGGHELYNITQNDNDTASIKYNDFTFGGLPDNTQDKRLNIYPNYNANGYPDNFHFWLRSLGVSVYYRDRSKPFLDIDSNSSLKIVKDGEYKDGIWVFRFYDIGKNPNGSNISNILYQYVAKLENVLVGTDPDEYYLVSITSIEGRWFLQFDQTNNDDDEPTFQGEKNIWSLFLDENSLFKHSFKIIYNIEKRTINLNYFQNNLNTERYLIFKNDNIIFNGLPFLDMNTPNFGSQYGTESLDANIAKTGDYYTAIERGHLIPVNIKPVDSVYKKWAYFCRLNEKYIGSKITYEEQQKDVLNWYVDLDLGFHNDTAIGFYNSVDEVNHQTSEGKGGNICGFTFFENWFPLNCRNVNTKDRQNNIFSMGRFCEMGNEVRSKEHHIRVFSRNIDPSNITNTNSKLTLDEGTYSEESNMGNSPYIITEHPELWQKKNKEYNVMLVSSLLYIADANLNDGRGGYKNRCINFVNFADTFSYRGGQDLITTDNKYIGVDYSFQKPNNFRQMYRILSGTGIGFDPSSTANPYGFAMNIQQANAGNELIQVFRSSGFQSDIKYSSYIEDYMNRIYIGATSPTIDFNISRFELKNFHTPRKFNNKDSAATSIGIGDTVAIFNDKDMNFQTIELDASLKTQRLNDFLFGICDAVSGIGIYKIYVKDENTNPNLSILDSNGNINKGYLECKKNTETGKPINYKKSLFEILGFSLEQLLPFYGSQECRFDNSIYNSINGFGMGGDNRTLIKNAERYKYTSFFTTNSYLSQINSQDMSLYADNFPDSTENTLRGTPDYTLGYVQFQKLALSVETDVLRGQNLPSRIENPYYIIYSNLPTSGYSTNGNSMNAIAYVYKQYKTADFYYSYASSYNSTLTQDTPISMIRTAIYNSNGELAQNIGSKSVFFYKVIMNMTLPEPEQPDSEETILLKSINKEINKMNDLQEITNLNLSNNYEKISVDEALTVMNKGLEKMGEEGQAAIKSMENFITNYLLSQMIDNNRVILSDYRRILKEARTGGKVPKDWINKYNNGILTTITKNRDEFNRAFNSIMDEIITTAPGNRNRLIKKIQKATRSRVSIPGLLSQDIGFIKKNPKGKKTDFFLSASPDMLQNIKEILTTPYTATQTRNLLKELKMTDDIVITTQPLRGYLGKTRATKFSRGQLDIIIKKLTSKGVKSKKGTGKLTPKQTQFLVDHKYEIDELIDKKSISENYDQIIDNYFRDNPEAVAIASKEVTGSTVSGVAGFHFADFTRPSKQSKTVREYLEKQRAQQRERAEEKAEIE
tara:strand:- start:110 stop:4975 length:4866 start_codon:yes stop_codon:yes gene_type:complete